MQGDIWENWWILNSSCKNDPFYGCALKGTIAYAFVVSLERGLQNYLFTLIIIEELQYNLCFIKYKINLFKYILVFQDKVPTFFFFSPIV